MALNYVAQTGHKLMAVLPQLSGAEIYAYVLLCLDLLILKELINIHTF